MGSVGSVPTAIRWDHIVLSSTGGVPLQTAGPTGTTPAQIRHAYGIDQLSFNGGTVPADGSGETIAIVDAYGDPDITFDLRQFDHQLGLPDPPSFTIMNQNGGSTLPSPPPASLNGWATETALDVEWAHVVAPGASILLVEANDQNQASDGTPTSLLTAVATAAKQPGVVVVSMSWGYPEFANEVVADSTFLTPSGHGGVTFVAASGDSGAPPGWPAISPNVLSVGGTTLNLDSAGNILSESGWSGSGGGLSTTEAQPSYQNGLLINNGGSIISAGGKRANPDVAYDSDPNTGFPVYDTFTNPASTPWEQVGGTSDAAPQWSALIAIADQGRALLGLGSLDGRSQILPSIYGFPGSNLHDITTGTSTGSPNYAAGLGYDLVTGRGSPIANQIVSTLDEHFAITAPSAATAGVAITLTITALDGSGHTLTSYGGLVHLISTDNQAVFPAATSLIGGVGVFSVTLKTAGSQTITAADTNISSFSGFAAVSVQPAAVARFGVNASPGAVVGQLFTLTVIAEDPFNNPTAIYNGTVHFTASDNAAVLPVDSSLTSGVGVFSATLQTLGIQTVTATDTVTNSIAGASKGISVSNPATHFRVTGTAAANAGNGISFTVTALDAGNATATAYLGLVHFTSSDSQATLPANALLVNGVGAFSATLKTAGGQVLIASDATAPSLTGTSNTITISGIAATHLAVSIPANIIAGVPFSFIVTAEDQFNNASPNFTGTVRFTSSDSRAALPVSGILTGGTGTFTATLKTQGNQSIKAVNVTSNVNFAQAPGSPLGVGTGVVALVEGDFNGDGKPDLAEANYFDNAVTILLGNGDGTFQTGGTYPVGTGPFSLAGGDVNHDGNLDLVAANRNSNNISVLLGNGNGTFQTATSYAVANSGLTTAVESVAVTDLNGDGKPDVAVTCYYSSTSYYGYGTRQGFVAVLMGNGNGSFGPATDYATGEDSDGIAVADFNHDGKPDLAVPNLSSDTISVLRGNGDGTFQSAVNFQGGSGPARIVAADFNGDGFPDLAVSDIYSSSVGVLLNTGNGTFGSLTGFGTVTYPASLAAVDINGDGKPDLVTGSLYRSYYGTTLTTNLTVLLNSGSGSFASGQNISSGGSLPFSIVGGDLNGDGAPDLAVADEYSGDIAILLNQQMTGATTVPVGAASASHFAVTAPAGAVVGAATGFTVTALDQFNNTATGYTGIVSFSSNPAGALLPANSPLVSGVGTFSSTFLTTGNQTLSVMDSVSSSITGVSGAITVTDPVTHFLFSTASTASAGHGFAITVTAQDALNNPVIGYTGTVRFTSSDSQAVIPINATLNNGVGAFSVTLKTAGSQTLIAADTLASNITGTSTVLVSALAASHFGVSGIPGSITAGTAFRFTVAAEDPFNNIVTGYSGTVHFASSDSLATLPANTTLVSGVGAFSCTLKVSGSQTLTITNASSSANFVQPAGSPIVVGNGPDAVAVGDFNGDSKLDLAVANYNDNTVTIELGNGDGTFQTGATYQVGANPSAIAVGSFSHNGKLDLVVVNQSANTVSLLRGNGDGSFGLATNYAVGVYPSQVTVADVNGDGNPDLVVANQNSGTVSVLLDNGNGTFQSAVTYAVGGQPQGVVAADLNHDGKLDLVVANEGTNNVSVLLGNGNGTFAPATNFGAGFHPVHIAIGDFNGDGNLDLATTNVTNNTVSVLLGNGNGTFGPAAAYATDKGPWAAATGDFSGDGNLDLVIANLNSGDLSVLLGNGNGTFGQTQNISFGGSNPYGLAVGDFDSQGVPDLVIANGGSNSITVLLNQGIEASTTLSVSPAPASHFAVTASSNVFLGGVTKFTVAALDPYNNAATSYGGMVHFTSSDNTAVLPANAFLTSGVGTFSATLNTPGKQTLFASDTAASSISGASNAILVTLPANHFLVSAPNSVTAGGAFAVTVTALDPFNNTVLGYSGAVQFTSSDGQATIPGNGLFSGGTGVFSVTLKTSGNQELTATDTVTSSITGASAPINVNAAAAARFVVTAPAAATAGKSIVFSVTAQDAYNNAATGYGGTVTFASTDPAATFSPLATGLISGAGIFTATLKTAGSQFLSAMDSAAGSVAGTSNAVIVSPLTATHFGIKAAAIAVAGQSFNFTVTAQDSFNNTAPGYNGSVNFSLGTSDSGAKLPINGQVVNGVGTFSATLTQTGNQTLLVADTLISTLTGASNAILVSAATATHFTVNAGPSPITAGNSITVTVTAFDRFNNTATGYNGTVTFTSSDTGAFTLMPANSSLNQGVGTFSVTLTTAGSQTLVATDNNTSGITGNITATSGIISVVAAPASHFVVSAQGATTAGSPITFTVAAEDRFNNLTLAYSGTVTFASSDNGPSTVLPASSQLVGGVGSFSATLTTAGIQTLTAIDANTSGLTGTITGTSGLIVVTGRSVTHFGVIAPGGALTHQPFTFTILAQDQYGNKAPGYSGTVALSSSDPAATLPATGVLTSGIGLFTATLATLGNQTLTAVDTQSSSLTGFSNSIAVTATPATHLVVSVSPSSITAGNAVKFTVMAEDQFNAVVLGYNGTVTFTSTDFGLSTLLPVSSPLTNGVGVFTAMLTTAGNQTLTAIDRNTSGITGTISGISATITVSAGPASHFAVSAPASVVVRNLVTFTVTAEDQFNNTANGYNGTVTFASSDTAAAFLPATSPLTGSVGVFSVSLRTQGNQTLTAIDNNTSGSTGTITGSSNTITVTAGTGTHFAVSIPSSTTAGSPFTFTVTALTPSNTTNTGYTGKVVFLGSDTNSQAIYPVPYTFTAADQGQHVFVNGITLVSAGPQTVTAYDGSNSSTAGTSNTVNVIPQSATHLSLTGPSATTAGSAIFVTVTARDRFGNVDTNYGGSVTLSATGDTAATFVPAGGMLTGGAGIFTATLFVASPSRSIVASGAGVSGAAIAVSVSAGLASQLVVVAPPTAVEGSSLRVTVTAEDPYSNTDTTYDNFVTLTDSLTNATFSRTIAGGSGVISVTLGTAGSRMLSATDTSINGVSNPITITAASHFVVAGPTTATAGGGALFTVMAEDNNGNVDTIYGGTVAFSSSDTSASFLPAKSTLAGGIGVFSVTLHNAGSQTLTATDLTKSSITGTSAAIVVNPGAATHFIVSAPATVTAGGVFSLTVTAADPFGNTARAYTGTVHFTSSDNTAVLTADSMLNSGVGAFSVTLKHAGSQTLTATDTVNSSIVGASGGVMVSPTAATHFAVSAPTAATAGSQFNFTVIAQDPFNNIATGYTGSATFSSSDSATTLPSAGTFTSGVGTFTATLRTAGNRTLTATDTFNSGISGVSNTIVVGASTATHFTFNTPTAATAGSPFSYTVTALDIFNNVATSYTGTLTFSSSDSLATPPNSGPLTGGSGIFTATLDVAGSQTLSATDKSTSSITGVSHAIAVQGAAATHFVLRAPAVATAGSLFAFTVLAEDGFNNAAPSYSGTVTFASGDKIASLPPTGTIAGGVGAFSATLATAGSQTVTAIDNQQSTVSGASNTINVVAAAASHFSINAPLNSNAGIGFNFTVQALDRFNNAASSYNGTVAFTSSDSAATLPAIRALAAGIGTFSVTLASLGAQTVTATDNVTSTISGTSSAITVNRPAATHFSIRIPATKATAGVVFRLTVTALDQFNHTVVNYSGTVTFSSSDSTAALQTGSILTSGVGTFSATLLTAGNQVLTATDTATSSIVGHVTVTVTAATAHSLSVTAPDFAIAGRAVSFTVTALDQFGNTATSYGGTVALATTDSAGTVPPTGQLTSGVGTFSATLVTVGNQSVSATDIVNSTVTGSATIDVPVTLSLPSHLGGAPGGVVTVPINVNSLYDPTSPYDQSGLSGGDFVLYYDPREFSVSNADVNLGTISSPSATDPTGTAPGNGYSPSAPNGWMVSSDTSTPGFISIILSNNQLSEFVTGTGGGSLVTVNFHILPNAPAGLSTIDLAADGSAAGGLAATSLHDGQDLFSIEQPYNLQPPPQNNSGLNPSYSYSGTDQVDSNVTVSSLIVTGFAPTPGSFSVTFNKPVDPSTVNFYTTGSLPDDVMLSTTGSQISVRGSVLFNATDTSFTFVKTDTVSSSGAFNPSTGLLAAGNYTITLRSFTPGSSGFEDLLGSPLDGAGTGSPGTNFVATFSVTAPPVAVGIPDFARGFSNTDAVFFASGLSNGSTFALTYTNPAANPTTGTATVTFSTTAATLESNIQTALTSGGLAVQVGSNQSNGIPNFVVIVTNDTSTGANVLVTFQNALATATNQLLASNTPGVAITAATINAANNIPGNGIPIALSSGLGITSGSFTLQYNPNLLTLGSAVSKIAGASFTLVSNNTVTGVAVLSLSAPSPISTNTTAITLGSLLATVPLAATASYGAQQLLHFASERLNGTAGPITVTGEDGVEVAAYFGDVTDAGGPLSLADATAISTVARAVPNVMTQTIPGFSAFPNTDPAIIGNVSLQGSVNPADAGAMLQEVGGTPRTTIPYAPIGLPAVMQGGQFIVNAAERPASDVRRPASAELVSTTDAPARPSGTSPIDQIFASGSPAVHDLAAAQLQPSETQARWLLKDSLAILDVPDLGGIAASGTKLLNSTFRTFSETEAVEAVFASEAAPGNRFRF
jgi:hypothetical protein